MLLIGYLVEDGLPRDLFGAKAIGLLDRLTTLSY